MKGWQTATVSQWKRRHDIQHDTQHNNKRNMTLSIVVKWCYVECYLCNYGNYAEWCIKPIMLSVVAPYINSNKFRSQRTKRDVISKLLSGLNFAFLKSRKKGDCRFWIAVPVCQIQNLNESDQTARWPEACYVTYIQHWQQLGLVIRCKHCWIS